MDRAERQTLVFSLREEGQTFEQIAKLIDRDYRRANGEVYTADKAYEDYQLYVATHVDLFDETEDTQRAMMSQRLTQLWRSNQNDLNAGRSGAIDRGLRIIDRQMKLYGLEKARRVSLELEIAEIADELMRQSNIPKEKRADVIRAAEKIVATQQAKLDRPRSGMMKRSTKE